MFWRPSGGWSLIKGSQTSPSVIHTLFKSQLSTLTRQLAAIKLASRLFKLLLVAHHRAVCFCIQITAVFALLYSQMWMAVTSLGYEFVISWQSITTLVSVMRLLLDINVGCTHQHKTANKQKGKSKKKQQQIVTMPANMKVICNQSNPVQDKNQKSTKTRTVKTRIAIRKQSLRLIARLALGARFHTEWMKRFGF